MAHHGHNDDLQSNAAPDHGLVLTFERGTDPIKAAAGAICELLPLVEDEQQFAYYGHTLHLDFAGFGRRAPEAVHEVREYLQAISAQWPWWVHFLTPDPGHWRTLLLALAPVTRQGQEWTTDVVRLRRNVLRLLRANRVLHRHFGVQPAASRVIALQTWTAMKEAAR